MNRLDRLEMNFAPSGAANTTTGTDTHQYSQVSEAIGTGLKTNPHRQPTIAFPAINTTEVIVETFSLIPNANTRREKLTISKPLPVMPLTIPPTTPNPNSAYLCHCCKP